MIPAGLSRKHVLAALESIVRDGIPSQRLSDRSCLVYNGAHFPPKYVVSLACKWLRGTELPALSFNAGHETNHVLEKMGFEIVSCRCGGVKAGARGWPTSPFGRRS